MKAVHCIISACAAWGLLCSGASATELLNKETAVKRMFLAADDIKEEVKTLSPAQLDAVKAACGGKLWAKKKPEGVNEAQMTFIFGSKAGAKQGVAVIEKQIDEWGPLTFIVVLDPATGKVSNAAMMEYVDGRSRDLANRAYLKSFFGKGASDPITIGKDIDAVAGATFSSGVLCLIVKKVAAAYKAVYLK